MDAQKQSVIERGIDCMKYRKSTHLAKVDVEAIIVEKGKCIFTIKDAIYKTNVDVNGKNLDGYFLDFIEPVKQMMANSGNRKTIASIIKIKKNCTSFESRNIDNWIGLTIELFVDENVKMKGEVVGGFRVSPVSPIPDISDKNGLTILNASKSMADLTANWSKLTKQEQALPTVNGLKDKLKGELANA
jgi:hypothetical protein